MLKYSKFIQIYNSHQRSTQLVPKFITIQKILNNYPNNFLDHSSYSFASQVSWSHSKWFSAQFPQHRIVFPAETTPRAIDYLRESTRSFKRTTTDTIFITHGRQSLSLDISRSAAFLSMHIRIASRQPPLLSPPHRSPSGDAQLTPNLPPIIRGWIHLYVESFNDIFEQRMFIDRATIDLSIGCSFSRIFAKIVSSAKLKRNFRVSFEDLW